MRHWKMRWLITLVAVGIAIAHFRFPAAAIDGVTATLLLVAVLPWLQPLFKSIELPGGVKVEFQDLEKVGERANAAGLLTPEPAPSAKAEYSFLEVAPSDPNLALAGLRIELEKRLTLLAQSRGDAAVPKGVGPLLRYLNGRELIGGAERGVLADLAALLNAAVHGAQVEPEAAEWAISIGPRILKALEERSSSSEIRYQGIVSED